MEASKFRLGDLPPAFKFDPTDADIVAYYLLPRALNLPNPYASAIIEADPASAPPWELLRRHGGVDHAFFFGPPTDPSKNGGRKNRGVEGGGVWQGQKGVEGTVTLVRGSGGGGEVDIRYKRYDLSFCRTKRGRATGYVMHEYEILSPPLPATVLSRIKVPMNAAKREPVAPAAAGEHQVPHPEQPGPSYGGEGFSGALVLSNGDGFGGAQDCVPYDGGMVENAGYLCNPLQNELPLLEYGSSYGVSIPDQRGASYYNYDAHASYGGGLVDTSGAYYDPSGYVPECGGDYSNYYGEHQQWKYQQDPSSSQYQSGDDAVMCAGGEQQAGALCGSSDNGSVVGTETSAQSTISLCGDDDGEVVLDDTGFYNMLFDGEDDFKCQQNDFKRRRSIE